MAKTDAKRAAAEVDVSGLGFEAAYRLLDETVARLEADDLTLDDSLMLYERGVALSERCGALLAAAELRVREVDGEGRDVGAVTLG